VFWLPPEQFLHLALSIGLHNRRVDSTETDRDRDRLDCRKLSRCRVRLRALYLALGLKPIIQLVTVCPSALLVKFVGAFLNLLLNRDQDGRFVRLRCEG
jgi:hypothetical protein